MLNHPEESLRFTAPSSIGSDDTVYNRRVESSLDSQKLNVNRFEPMAFLVSETLVPSVTREIPDFLIYQTPYSVISVFLGKYLPFRISEVKK
jgi:hypothetical protein